MSLILDALQKADNERKQHEATPSIDSRYEAPESSSSNKKNFFWALTGLAIAVLLALALWFIRQDSPTEASIQSSKPKQAPETIADNKPTAPVFGVPDSLTHSNKTEANPEKNEQATLQKLSDTRDTQEQQKQQSAIAELYNDKVATVNSEAADTTKPSAIENEKTPNALPYIEKKEEQTPSFNTETLAAYQNTPLIKELPYSLQENIPTLMYGEHNYVMNQRSDVTLNGKRYFENSNIGGGIVIEKILEDGMILKKAEHRFKMLALNSWLNF